MVGSLIRGKSVDAARSFLQYTPNKSAKPMLKLLNSAVASALQKFHIDAANLYISKLFVDEGPKLKRFRPRARGQAYPIHKKTSHITIELDEIKKGTAVPKAAAEVNEPKTEEEKEGKPETPKTFAKPETKQKMKDRLIKAPRFFRRKAI